MTSTIPNRIHAKPDSAPSWVRLEIITVGVG